MPKIRGVKPDYWTDDMIAELTIPARLLFIGLWNFACDNGHLQDKPKQIKRRILPDDAVDILALLDELSDHERIIRTDGWITIPNLTEHQKPDRRYFTTCDKADCDEPESTTSQRNARRATPVHTPGAPSAHTGRTPVALVDGDGDGELKVMVKGTSRKRSLPPTWTPTEDHQTFASEERLDLPREVAQFRDHHAAKGSVMVNWDAAFRTWLRNAQKFGRVGAAQPERFIPSVHDLELPPDGLSPAEYADWDAAQRAKRVAQ